MNPKFPIDGRIYTLTVGSILTTNVSQTNLCWLLFRPALKIRLDSCLSRLQEGLIHEWKQALLASPLPLMLLNNSRLRTTHNRSSAFFSTAL